MLHAEIINFKIILFVLGYFALIHTIFYLRNKDFLSSNVKPSLKSIDSLKIKNNIHKVPVVKTGMVVQGFPIFDINQNNFLMNAYVWFQFNRSLISIDNLEKFTFLNATNVEKKITQVSVDDDEFFVEYQVKVEFCASLDHKFFPLNDHSIYIVLVNNELTSEEVIFDCNHSSVKLGEDLQINDWTIVSHEAEPGYEYANTSKQVKEVPYPRVVYTLNAKKVGLRKFASVILPTILIFLISSSVLLVGNFTENEALSVSIGCLTGILAYRYVINNMSPNVGYFTLTECLYNYCLFIIFVNFLLILDAEIEGKNSFPTLGPIFFFSSVTVLLVYIIYLLYFSSYHSRQKQTTKFKSQKFLENVESIDISKWTKSHFEKIERFEHFYLFARLKNLLSVQYLSWPHLLKWMDEYRLQIDNESTELTLSVNAQANIYIFANISNNIDDFMTYINELIHQNILDNQLKLKSSETIIIFHQNIWNNIKDFTRIFPLQLVLMLKNLNQVFLLQDDYYINNIWQSDWDGGLANWLHKRHPKMFSAFIKDFFKALPTNILIDVQTRNSNYLIQLISELNKKDIKLMSDKHIDVRLCNINGLLFKNPRHSLLNTIPVNGTTEWFIGGGNKKHLEFTVLRFSQVHHQAYLDLYYKLKKTKFKFKRKSYDLIYSYKMNDTLPSVDYDSSIIIGSSCDLSKSIHVFARQIAEGTTLGFLEQNQLGGINKNVLKSYIMDDEYNPQLTLKNANKLIHMTNALPLMLSGVGTVNTEILLSSILDKKLFMFFPVTGADYLRKEQYEHLVFFRASYQNEVNTITHDLLHVHKCNRVAIFYQNDGFGLSLLEPTLKIFQEHDIKFQEIPHQRNNPDTRYAATMLREFNPDALIFYTTSFPAISLVHDLGVNLAANIKLYISSPGNVRFVHFAMTSGLHLNYCLAVPPLHHKLEIVEDFKNAFTNMAYGFEVNSSCFEGYINARILCDILLNMDGPISSQNLLNRLEQMKNYSFKGLKLNYNPETRELFNYTWLEKL